MPARAARAGERAHQGAARRARASPTCAAWACCIAAELDDGHRGGPGRERVPGRRAGRQRGHADRAAVRAVAARHRRRDRRRGGDPHRGARADGAVPASMTPRFLEVDDLTPRRVRRGPRRGREGQGRSVGHPAAARRARASCCCSRSRRPARRASTEMAVVGLGGHPIYVRPEEVGLGVRESVDDVARTLAGFCSVIAARVFDHATLGGDGGGRRRPGRQPAVRPRPSHARPSPTSSPCASCSASLEGRRLVYVGDGNNVTASLAFAAALSRRRAHRRVAAGLRARRPHRGAGPQPRRHRRARRRPPRGGRRAPTPSTPTCGRRWARRRSTASRLAAFAGYTVDDALMAAAGEQAWFLHCLPAHRGEEVAASVIDGPRSVVWQQAANRMHAGPRRARPPRRIRERVA